jgi:hypothetical protein
VFERFTLRHDYVKPPARRACPQVVVGPALFGVSPGVGVLLGWAIWGLG